MTIHIRKARPDDVDTLVAFNVAMAAESEDKGLDESVLRNGIEVVLDSPSDGLYFIAERDGDAAGALMITFEWSDWRNGRFWWIQSVFVEAKQRRLGIYRALHEHVRDLAKADDRSCGIRLYVERDNTGAQATYDAMGMHETAYRLYEEEWSPR
jgi:GNAT superfamily N-acetyltransferase